MILRPFRLALSLGAWANVAFALMFTNSFNDWVGNSTYDLTWDSSPGDPDFYNLIIARPHDIYAAGVKVDNTAVDWSTNVATQVASTGDHYLKFTLPPSLWPGVYYMLMQSGTNTSLTSTFRIASHDLPAITSIGAITSVPMSTPTPATSLAPTSIFAEQTTIASYVEVTATQTGLVSKDGHMVTVMPSEVYSSEVVFTTVIVESGESKGTLQGKIPIIVGLVIGVTFLLTLPVIIWLVLKYRRRPITSTENSISDKYSHPPGAEDAADLNTLDLIGPDGMANAATNDPPTSRQIWAIVGGKKRLVTVSGDPQQTLSSGSSNPFADPVSPSAPRPQQLPRLSIPDNSVQPSTSPPIIIPNDTPLSSRNTGTVPSPMHPSEDTHSSLSMAQIQEKMAHGGRQRSTRSPAPPTLSPEQVSTRIFVPGRAVDMGPLGRARVGDVDENGLLPPDYCQATQPISSSAATQAAPSRSV
ncbi:hypothetical protein FRC08_009407 [Ceratobasidium sp. 394]|nr:hypothetical protein FRC08_009407 [Ceratobasidium sp. 394]